MSSVHLLVSLPARRAGMMHKLQSSAKLHSTSHNKRLSCNTRGTSANFSGYVASLILEKYLELKFLAKKLTPVFHSSQPASPQQCERSLPTSAPYIPTLHLPGLMLDRRILVASAIILYHFFGQPERMSAVSTPTLVKSCYNRKFRLSHQLTTATAIESFS